MHQEVIITEEGKQTAIPQAIGVLIQQQSLYKEAAPLVEQTLDEMIANVMLTEEEAAPVIEAALRQARVDKYWRLRDERVKQIQMEAVNEAKRPWTWQEMLQFMYAKCIQNKIPTEVLDRIRDNNGHVVEMICRYFTDDPEFEKMGNGFSLKKGLWLYGYVGTGKTTLLKLAQRNKKRCFAISECVGLQNMFMADGENLIEAMKVNRMEPKDMGYFFHQEIGRAFDDLGTEETITIHYGNKRNVMAEVLLGRYGNRAKFGFEYTHVTTNKTLKEIESLYGTRVHDRIFDMFNIIGMEGGSLRKNN